MSDLQSIRLRGAGLGSSTRLDMVSRITPFEAPTEVDHYQIRRRIDVLVRPAGEDLGKLSGSIDRIVASAKLPANVAAYNPRHR